MSINAAEQAGYRKPISRQLTVMPMMNFLKFRFPATHWSLGYLSRIATKQQSLMVIAPAVITVMVSRQHSMVPELFMSINAQEQLGYRKRTSRQSTMMLLMDLVIQFHYQATHLLLVHQAKQVMKTQSPTVLLLAVTIVIPDPEQFMFTNAQEQAGHRKHTSRL